MYKERILAMIDKKIIESLVDGHAIRFIQDELDTKMNKFAYQIRESVKKIDLYKLLQQDPNTIGPTKVRWQVVYIKGCQQRIKDLNWLQKNKHKFPTRSNSEVFKLIKLKDKLSEENSLPF